MDPLAAITTALIAGASAAASNVASDAVKDAYRGLKKIVVDVYDLVSASLLDREPSDETYRKAVEREVTQHPEIGDDMDVLQAARSVHEALLGEPQSSLAALGVDIEQIRAAGDVVFERISGTGGGVRAKRVESKGDVRFTDVRGGGGEAGQGKK